MAQVRDLDKATLREVVTTIQEILWFDGVAGEWDRDKEWDSETIEDVAEILVRKGLRPNAT
jgi:hypothetical protein